MSSAASLYGNLSNSANPMARRGVPTLSQYEDLAYDAGQAASAANVLPEPSSYEAMSKAFGSVSDVFSSIGSLISNHIKSETTVKNLSAQIAATEAYRDRFLLQYDRATEQLNASQIVGYISSGLALDSGTPQVVMAETSKERKLERDWNQYNFEMTIRNLQAKKNAAKKSGVLGDIFGTASVGLNIGKSILTLGAL